MWKKFRVGGEGRRQRLFWARRLGGIVYDHVLENPGIMIASSRGIHVGIDVNLT